MWTYQSSHVFPPKYETVPSEQYCTCTFWLVNNGRSKLNGGFLKSVTEQRLFVSKSHLNMNEYIHQYADFVITNV